MILKNYTIANGLTSNKMMSKTNFAIVVSIFVFILYLVDGMYTIVWYEHYLPSIITRDENEVILDEMASVYTFLFLMLIVLFVSWLSSQAKSYCSRSSFILFKTCAISERYIYALFLLKRTVDLFLIGMAYVTLLFCYFLIFHGAYPYLLYVHIYILFGVCITTILIFDLIQFSVRNQSISGFFVFIVLIGLSIVKAITVQKASAINEEAADALLVIPDIFLLLGGYITLSFGGIVEVKHLLYPLVFVIVALGLTLYLSKDFYRSFSRMK